MLDNKTITKLKISIQRTPNMEYYDTNHLNCYAYALGITYFDVKDTRIHYYPGLLSSDNLYNSKNHPKTYEEYFQCIQSDCNMLNLRCSSSLCSDKLEEDQYMIGIYHHQATTKNDMTSAHFVRYDHSIGWSHKLGWYKPPELLKEAEYCMFLNNNTLLFSLIGFVVVDYAW